MTTIPGNRWDQLDVDPVGATRRVSVCIPARDAGAALDRTLAALRVQRYPADAFEVVVVDDSSSPPLAIDPGGWPLSVHRHDGGRGFGAAGARNAAAAVATGDILVFLDADVIPSRDFVAAMARWFDATDDAVVLGAMRFVDVDDLSAAEVERLLLDGSWDEAAQARRIPGQDWRDVYFAQTRGFTVDEVDLFRVVTGAALAVHRERFREVGGFADVDIRGVGDTELGYRLMTNGGVLVPEAAALAWHQGRPTLRGGAARRNRGERRATTEQLLPVGGFRGPRPLVDADGRVVPRAVVHVVGDPSDRRVARAVERIRAVGSTDVAVTTVDTIAPDGRFTPAFARIWCSPDHLWGPGTLLRVIDALSAPDVGRLRVPSADGGVVLEAYTTRSLCRAARADGASSIGDRAARLFGDRWVAAERIDLRVVGPDSSVAPIRRRERWAQQILARLRWIGHTGRRRVAQPPTVRNGSDS